MPPAPTPLTELEAVILAEVASRSDPTPYGVMKALSTSPLTGLSGSPGAVYPAIRRLQAAGLLTTKVVRTTRRRLEHLKVSDPGLAAVRTWIASVQPVDLLPHDPLRAKLLYFGLLTHEQQKLWIAEMRRALRETLKVMHDCAQSADGPKEFAVATAVAGLKQRRSWVERLADRVEQEPAEN